MKADPRTLTKWVTRLALPVVLVAGLVFARIYWFRVIPAGVDTMLDTHPPGALCIIRRSPDVLQKGSVVFVEVQPGATPLVARVDRVDGDRIHLAIDNRASPFAGYFDRTYPRSSIRGLVLTTFERDAENAAARNLPEKIRDR